MDSDNFRAFALPAEKVVIQIPKPGTTENVEMEQIRAQDQVHFIFTWELTKSGERPLKVLVSFKQAPPPSEPAREMPMLRLEFDGANITKIASETITYGFHRELVMQGKGTGGRGVLVTMRRNYFVKITNLQESDRIGDFLEQYLDKTTKREWWK